MRRQLALGNGWPEIEEATKTAAPKVRSQLLTMLSSCSFLTNDHPALECAIENMRSDSAEVRHSAAKLVSFRFPEHAPALLALSKLPGFSAVEQVMCLSQNCNLILPLAGIAGYPETRSAHLAFGILLTPEWLAHNFERSPDLVNALSQDCGYSSGPLLPELVVLLRKNLMFVSSAMLDTDPDDLQARVLELSKGISNVTAGLVYRNLEPLKIGDRLDEDLFLAALREADKAGLGQARNHDPYDYHRTRDRRVASCCHAPIAHCRREYIEKGLKKAAKLGISSADLGAFLLERAARDLEVQEEVRLENRMIHRASWKAWSRTQDHPRLPELLPVLSDQDAPLLKYAVLDPNKKHALIRRPQLSKGAQGVAHIADYLNRVDVVDSLIEDERSANGRLPVIGCELQIRRGEDHAEDTLAWKQAFRYFGINSPRRPEFGTMLELAFPPASSANVFYHGINLLPALGLFSSPAEAALHISIEGDLGEDVKYIIFPQQFLRSTRRIFANEAERCQMVSGIMSKGLVCLNADVQSHNGKTSPKIRTELRGFSVNFEQQGKEIVPDSAFKADLEGVQMLVAALLSNSSELAQLWWRYRESLESYVATLPLIFSELLHCNWYEASGDPYDASLVPQLEVIKLRTEARQAMRDQNIGSAVRHQMWTIRSEYVAKINEVIGREESL